MRHGIAAGMAVILMMTAAACGTDAEKTVERYYREMKNYQAVMTVTVFGNKSDTTYRLRQRYDSPDQIRDEVLEPQESVGTVYTVCGNTLTVSGEGLPTASLEVSQSDTVSVTSVADFFASYFANGRMEKTETSIMLYTEGNAESRYHVARTLELDVKTFRPLTLFVFDRDGNLVIRSEVEEFERNKKAKEDTELS